MTSDLAYAREVARMVDLEHGLVDRRIFYDEQIYRLELEQIFARAWLFLAHDSQIPNPGDFFMNFMGEDRVIVVRDNDGLPQVLINSCRHRGNAVCRADEGHATSFMCTYHGWTYDLKGSLVGVPGFKEVYHEELERENWGLIKAAQVETYKGLIFATMDAGAPPLMEYLGDSRFGLDLLVDQGDMEALGGVHKWTMQGTNWKFPTDNSTDQYHAFLSHASAMNLGGGWAGQNRLGRRPQKGIAFSEPQGFTVLSDYGHACIAYWLPDGWQDMVKDDALNHWRLDPEVQRSMGPVFSNVRHCNMNVTPHLWINSGQRQLSLRQPRGPQCTEIWTWSFVDRKARSELRNEFRVSAERTFGPAGMLEQEDGENWAQSTQGTGGLVSSRYPLNYQMRLGHGEIVNQEVGPPRIGHNVSENAQMWTHQGWADFMAASDWDDLKTNRTRPVGRI